MSSSESESPRSRSRSGSGSGSSRSRSRSPPRHRGRGMYYAATPVKTAALVPFGSALKAATPTVSGSGPNTKAALHAIPKPIAATPRIGATAGKAFADPALNKRAHEKFDTVVYPFDVTVSADMLQAQPDGGRTLTLTVANNGLKAPKFSNPADASAEMKKFGACDFVAEVSLDNFRHNSTELQLTATPSVRALGNETADARGHVTAVVHQGREASVLRRDVTAGQLQILRAYPGQTADNIGNWVVALPNNAKEKLILLNPPPAMAFFWNTNEKVIASKLQLPVDGTSKHASAQHDAALVDEMLALTKARLSATVALSDVTNAEALSLTFSSAPKSVMQRDGTFKNSPVSLAHGYRFNASNANLAATMLSLPGGEALLAKSDAKALKGTMLTFSGDLKIKYLKVHPNFELSDGDIASLTKVVEAPAPAQV